MTEAVPILKDPEKVRAGRLGARTRWGPLRVVRLETLPPEQARAIRAYLDVARATAAEPEPPGSGQG